MRSNRSTDPPTGPGREPGVGLGHEPGPGPGCGWGLGLGLGLGLYGAVWGAALVATAPYLLYRTWRRPEEMRQRFGAWGTGAPAGEGALWLHAASLGETRGALSLLRELAARDQRVLFTTVTPTAYGQRDEVCAAGACAVRFAPLDFGPLVSRVVGRARPRALLIAETEVWPALLHAARACGVPVAFVNGRMTAAGAARLAWARPWVRRVLADAHVCAQTQADAQRWMGLGVRPERLRVTGNTKYERPHGPLEAAQRAALRGGWRTIVVFGSVRSGEAAAVADALRVCRALPGPALFVVAPRHRERAGRILAPMRGVFAVEQVRAQREETLVPRAESIAGEPDSVRALLHLDTVGELRRYYAIADAAFIGATLCPIGGHNPFEACEWGVPVLYGPHTQNVADVVAALDEHGGGRRVAGGRALGDAIVAWMKSPKHHARAQTGALRAAEALGGAAARTLSALAAWGIVTEDRRPASGPAED